MQIGHGSPEMSENLILVNDSPGVLRNFALSPGINFKGEVTNIFRVEINNLFSNSSISSVY